MKSLNHLKTFEELQSSTLRSAADKFKNTARPKKSREMLSWITKRNLHKIGELDIVVLNKSPKSYELYSSPKKDRIDKFNWKFFENGHTGTIELEFFVSDAVLLLQCGVIDNNKLTTNYKWKIGETLAGKGLLMNSRESSIKFKKLALSNISQFIIEDEGVDNHLNEEILKSINRSFPKLDVGPDDVKEMLEALNKLSINSLWIEQWDDSVVTLPNLYKSLNNLNK